MYVLYLIHCLSKVQKLKMSHPANKVTHFLITLLSLCSLLNQLDSLCSLDSLCFSLIHYLGSLYRLLHLDCNFSYLLLACVMLCAQTRVLIVLPPSFIHSLVCSCVFLDFR